MDGAECFTLRGGEYNPNSSSTAEHAANIYSAGADPGDISNVIDGIGWVPSGAWVNDDFGVGDVTLEHYPIGMLGTDPGSQYVTQVRTLLRVLDGAAS